MPGLRWVQLSGDALDEFLGKGGTGVISFTRAADESPVSFPVSYGYAADTTTFYFRLSFLPGSDRDSIVEQPMAFVTSEQTDRGWQSVVATGVLEDIESLPYDSVTVQEMWAIDIPTIDIFDEVRSEITFHDFCLDPESLTGRKEVEP